MDERKHLLMRLGPLIRETVYHVSPWRSTKGVKPDALKGASPIVNGGDEETGLCRPRLVATQLECAI
jgi:hypothetical protein